MFVGGNEQVDVFAGGLGNFCDDIRDFDACRGCAQRAAINQHVDGLFAGEKGNQMAVAQPLSKHSDAHTRIFVWHRNLCCFC